MGRIRTGSICLKDNVIYARVRWTDDDGKRKEKTKKAENKTHARQLIKKMLREIDFIIVAQHMQEKTYISLDMKQLLLHSFQNLLESNYQNKALHSLNKASLFL